MERQTLLPQRIEAVRSPKVADEKTLRMCDSERDAVLVSIQLSSLTYDELGARIGVTKQAVNKWTRKGVPSKRVRAFCNATGSLLLQQYIDMQRALREITGRVREYDRIAAIAEHALRKAA